MASLQTFAENMSDKARELPNFKELALPGIKETVAQLLQMIGRTEGIFSTYTKHDISHVDAMLEMLGWLIPQSTKEIMTPVDWLLITLAAYLHDLGLLVTHDEYINREENPKFRDFISAINKDPDSKDYLARAERMSGEERERFFYQEFVRQYHAVHIREWITGRHSSQWGNNVRPLADEIARLLQTLPSRFRDNLGYICESHHSDSLDKTENFPLAQHYGTNSQEVANIQYAAILLRTIDLLHVTKDRTPSIMYKIIRLSDPKGIDEWQKQMGAFSVNMKHRELCLDDPNSQVIQVGADFTEERAYFALAEYLAYADIQIAQSRRWAEASQKTTRWQTLHFSVASGTG